MANIVDILEAHAIGIPVDTTVELLKQILGIENDTIKRLNRIEKKVDRLLEEHYSAAMEHVESASLRGISDYERQRRLDLARDCLIEACAVAGDDFVTLAAAEVALASLHHLRAEHDQAVHYAQRAYLTSLKALAQAVDQADSIKVGRYNVARKTDIILKLGLTTTAALLLSVPLHNKGKEQLCDELRKMSYELREVAVYIGVPSAGIPPFDF